MLGRCAADAEIRMKDISVTQLVLRGEPMDRVGWWDLWAPCSGSEEKSHHE